MKIMFFQVKNKLFSKVVELNNKDISKQIIPGNDLLFVNSNLLNADIEPFSLKHDKDPVVQAEVENFSGGQMLYPPPTRKRHG